MQDGNCHVAMINEAAVAESVTRRVQGRLSEAECVDTAAAVNAAGELDGRLEKAIQNASVGCGKYGRTSAAADADWHELDDATGSGRMRAGDGDRVNDVV